MRGAKLSMSRPRARSVRTMWRISTKPRGRLLDRVQARFTEEVGVLEITVEFRHLPAAELDDVAGHPQVEIEGHLVRIGAMFGIERPLDHGTAKHGRRDTALLRQQIEARHHEHRRRGTRNRHLVERDAVEQFAVVIMTAERDALRADGVSREWVIGIHQRHRRTVADHIETGLAESHQILELLIRAFGIALA